nr:MAG TPA: hypothetical protein [Caudoviricetes sp.]
MICKGNKNRNKIKVFTMLKSVKLKQILILLLGR